MKEIVLAIFLFAPSFGKAQTGVPTDTKTFLLNINGQFIRAQSEYNTIGSKYFNEEYCNASIRLSHGKIYRDLPVKLDLLENRLVYRTPDGNEMEAISAVESISFGTCDGKNKPSVFRSGYPDAEDPSGKVFYQLLDTGRIQLLKRWKIRYTDQKFASTITTVRKFETTPLYYAYSPEKGMIRLEKNNTAVLSLFPGEKNKSSQFVNEQHLNLKKEEDLMKFFAFLNTL